MRCARFNLAILWAFGREKTYSLDFSVSLLQVVRPSTHRHCHAPNARTLCLQHISFNFPILGFYFLCISMPFITLRHQSVQLYQKKTTSCMGTSFLLIQLHALVPECNKWHADT